MKRSTKYTLGFATKKKQKLIEELFSLYKKYLQKTIDLLWNGKIPLNKLMSSKDITWMDNLGGQWKALIYKHASEIVRSCRFKKGRKHKPIVKNLTINIDERIAQIRESDNSFDKWIEIRLPFIVKGYKNKRIRLYIPIREHKRSLQFKDWKLLKTIKLNKDWISLVFEKEEPKKRQEGKTIGIDIGYKNLIVTSEGQFIGKGFNSICKKIARKKRGSKAYERALKERDNEVNRLINKELDLSNVKILKVEALKNVKKDSKFSKKFNNKLQYWVYRKILDKLERVCEQEAVQLFHIPPAYSSQTCPICQFRHKDNRKGEKFKCLNCGYEAHADYVGACNIASWESIVSNTEKAREACL